MTKAICLRLQARLHACSPGLPGKPFLDGTWNELVTQGKQLNLLAHGGQEEAIAFSIEP